MTSQYATIEGLDSAVIFQLQFHRGKVNAVPRWDLVRRLFGDDATTIAEMSDDNPYDRHVRKSIERLRKQGHHIGNDGSGNGYYICMNRAEYEAWKKYYLGSSYEKWIVVHATDESADQRWGKVPKTADPLPLFAPSEQGQGIVEYLCLIALVVMVIILLGRCGYEW